MISSGWSYTQPNSYSANNRLPVYEFYRDFCDKIGIDYGTALLDSRKYEVILPKKLFCWFAFANNYTYREIYEFLGYNDHTSVLHHVKDHESNLFDQRYKELYYKLTDKVGHN